MAKWTEAQQKAIDVRDGNYLVSAGAGSGKTAVLTERVYRLLKEGTPVSSLLVLTFTNKAAFEMKERVRKNVLKDPETSYLAPQIDSSNIMTFDAYALQIVKKYHYLLNVSRNVKIVDASILDVKKRLILDNIFDKLYKAKDEKFVSLISSYSIKKDDDIKDFILRIDAQSCLKENKIQYLKEYESQHYSELHLEKNIEEFRQMILHRIDSLRNLAYFFENTQESEAIISLFDKLSTAKTLDELINLLLVFSFPRMAKGLEQSDKDLHTSIKEEFDKKIKKLADVGTSFDVRARYFATRPHVSTIINIILAMNKELDYFKTKYEVFTFNDISFMALQIVSLVEVNKEIKRNLKYIMIDEFQDTSDIQEKFISLISNNNVYVVGDIKQSIYRFRNANSDIFKAKYDEYKKGKGGELICLLHNFRSRNEVIEDINKTFSKLMSEEIGGANYKLDHNFIHGNLEYDNAGLNSKNNHLELYRYNLLEDKSETEARIIAEDIILKINSGYVVYDRSLTKLRPCRYDDFAVLLDRTTKFDTYQKVFNAYNIPLNMAKDEDIKSTKVVVVIKNLVKLFSLIGDSLTTEMKHLYASIARSFIMSKTDQEIYDDISQNKLYQSEVFMKLISIKKELMNLSLSEILLSIINSFDIINKIPLIGDTVANQYRIESMVNASKTMELMGYSFEEYVNYFAYLDSYDIGLVVDSNVKLGNSVQLMNIHKSKGLEFNIIYYGGLSSRFNSENTKSQFMVSSHYGIVMPQIENESSESIHRYLIINEEQSADISEKMRLFYVALTRAKEKMILLYENKENNKPIYLLKNANSFYDFINYFDFESSYFKDVSLSASSRLSINKTNDVIYPLEIRNITIESKELLFTHASKTVVEPVEESLLDFGTKMHQILELIDLSNPDYSLIKDPNELAIIKRFLNNPIFADVNKGKVFHEYEFVDEINNTRGIIDLLIVYEDHIDIIDYKLKSIDDVNYDNQLATYANYIKSISNKPINKYLISIIDGRKRMV